MTTCTRPALRYMGGKWRVAPRIISKMPPHRTYLEPFGGAASVLLRKPRCYREIYNDLDGQVVNLFRVLRDPVRAVQLAHLVELTPWARAEFEESYQPTDDPVERARRTVVRSFMGSGSTAVALRRRTGFRALSNKEGKPPQRDWMGMPAALLQLSERLSGVVIENKPALELMAAVDDESALIYADPPYVHETRSQKRIGGSLEHAYAHEMGGGRARRAAGLAGQLQIHGAALRLPDGSLRRKADRLGASGLRGLRRWRPRPRRMSLDQPRRGPGGRRPVRRLRRAPW